MTRPQLDRLLEKTVADALGVKLAARSAGRSATPHRASRLLSVATARRPHAALQLQHA